MGRQERWNWVCEEVEEEAGDKYKQDTLYSSTWEPAGYVGLGTRQTIFTLLPVLHFQFIPLILNPEAEHLLGPVIPL